MWFDVVAERFLGESPFCMMTRATLEHVFADSFLDSLFAEHAQLQYKKELAFSTIASLLTEVVLRVRTSVRDAYRQRQEVAATLKSVYEKLQNTETAVCEALVEQVALRSRRLLEQFPDAQAPDPIPGLRLRVVDGNFLAGTDHRLAALRGCGAAALPGMTVALRDDRTGLLTHLICRQEAYTSERALHREILNWVEPGDLLVADRHYCTGEFFVGLPLRQGFYLIRHHQATHLTDLSELRRVGRTANGEVYEKRVRVGEKKGAPECRCVVVKLDEPTRDGEAEVVLLSNVSRRKAGAVLLAEVYQRRWCIEHTFQILTDYLRCEVDTLGYPKAALLGFSVAVCAYNLTRVLKGAMSTAVGREGVEAELSEYAVATEVAQDYSGMVIALPEEYWERFAQMSEWEMAGWLKQAAARVRWHRYRKARRNAKKGAEAQPPPAQAGQKGGRKNPHRCTARVLAGAAASRPKPTGSGPVAF